MLEIFLYAIGVMYSPGPVNLVGLNTGFNHKFRESVGFFVGVGTAMFLLFLLFGYTGEMIVKKEYLPYVSLFGSLFILYLALKLMKEKVDLNARAEAKTVTFKDGLFMHLLNPKATLATLPIATIHFPAHHITGGSIFFLSFLLSLLGVGAPGSYSLVGEYVSKRIRDHRWINVINKVMAAFLLYVAFRILMDHVYLVLVGGQ